MSSPVAGLAEAPASFAPFRIGKIRTISKIASVSRMFERNLLPSPSPFDAPATRPAMSTNSIAAGIVLADCEKVESLPSRASGTATIPTDGSIVQNG